MLEFRYIFVITILCFQRLKIKLTENQREVKIKQVLNNLANITH